MRTWIFALLFLTAIGTTSRADELLDQLNADPTKKKSVKAGMRLLDDFFKAEAAMRKPKVRDPAKLAGKMTQAKNSFTKWMEGTQKSLGVDLGTKPQTIIDMLDQARVKYLGAKLKKGKVDYIRVKAPRGMERHEYTVLVPKNYKATAPRMPFIISMHGRVINPKHPAFRSGNFNERSRQPVWNNWNKSPAADEALIIAPTGLPNGFTFSDDKHYSDLSTLYRTLGEALTNYRVDWNRAFLEVEGQAMRVICEQTFMFAGFIVRDRVDDRKRQFIPKEQWFMFDNLNGVPLIYVAGAKHWKSVGEPMSKALTKAYRRAKAPENLLVIQAKRDVDDALKVDPIKIKEFIVKHKRVQARREFRWRFFRETMANPMPLEMKVNTLYDVSDEAKNASLNKKSGSMNVSVKTEMVKDADGKETPQNLVTVNVTEAEGFTLYLQDGLIDFAHPLTIKVNGDVIVDKKIVKRDWNMFWNAIVPRRFFMVPYLGSEQVKFDLVPKFQPKKKPAEKPKDATKGKKDATKGK